MRIKRKKMKRNKITIKDFTKLQIDTIGNGCGMRSIERWIPDFAYTEACKRHDVRSWIGGYLFAYVKTQVMFLWDMLHDIGGLIIKNPLLHILILPAHLLVAIIYFSLVFSILGVFFFEWGKPKTSSRS